MMMGRFFLITQENGEAELQTAEDT